MWVSGCTSHKRIRVMPQRCGGYAAGEQLAARAVFSCRAGIRSGFVRRISVSWIRPEPCVLVSSRRRCGMSPPDPRGRRLRPVHMGMQLMFDI